MPTKNYFSAISSALHSSSAFSSANNLNHHDSISSPDSRSTTGASSEVSIQAWSGERGTRGDHIGAAPPLIRRKTQTERFSHGYASTKHRMSRMLSGLDLRSKQALSPAEPEGDNVAQESSIGPTNPTISFSTTLSAKKKVARGAAERDNHSELRDFFNANPARPEDHAQTVGPVSRFDWDDSSDGDSNPRIKFSNIRGLQRVKRRLQIASFIDGTNFHSSREDVGINAEAGSWPSSIVQNRVTGDCDESEGENTDSQNQRGRDKSDGDESLNQSPPAIKRTSVLKLFSDPVWNCGDSMTSPISSSAGDTQSTSSPKQERAESEGFSSSSIPTSTCVPYSAYSATNTMATQPSRVNDTQQVSGISVIHPFECKPKAARILGAASGLGAAAAAGSEAAAEHEAAGEYEVDGSRDSYDGKLTHRVSKTAVFKKRTSPRSSTFDPIETFARPQADTSPPQSTKTPSTPTFPSPLRREISADEDRRSSTLNPVEEGASREPSVQTTISAGEPSDDSPRRQSKGEVDQPVAIPGFGAYGYKYKPPASPPTLSFAESFEAKTRPFRGYPMGPENPNWDDAVRRVKKIVADREKREAEEAKQQEKEAKQQEKEAKQREKKLKRLKAGKDMVLESSQLGLALRKPLHEMTEEDFEIFGALAIAPGKETPFPRRSGIFGSLFTKMRGTNHQEHAEETKRQLNRHRSLELINKTPTGAISGSPSVGSPYCYTALRALVADEYGETDLGSSLEESLKIESADTTPKVKPTTKCNSFAAGHATNIGLGITQEKDTQQKPDSDKDFKGPNLQKFVAQKRPRKNLDGEAEPRYSISEGPPLPNIPEEDSRADLTPGKEHSTAFKDANNTNATRTITVSGQEEHAKTAGKGKATVDPPSVPLSRFAAKSKFEEDSPDDDAGSWSTESTPSNGEKEQMATSGPESPEQDGDPTPKQSDPSSGTSGRRNYSEEYDALSDYPDDIQAEAMPAPLRIRVLKVKRSSLDPQSPNPNSFVPDRKASFHAKIKAVGRLQEVHIGDSTHPALRGSPKSDDHDDGKGAEDVFKPTSAAARAQGRMNSKTFSVSKDCVEVEEGFTSGIAVKKEFRRVESPKTPLSTGSRSPLTNKGQTESGIEGSGSSGKDGVRDMNLDSSDKHPHHPFAWHHEKVMCRQIHNPTEILPETPTLGGTNAPVRVSSFDSNFFNSSPSKTMKVPPKKCENDDCGTYCCRFGYLSVVSKPNSGGDVMEEMVRTKGRQRVEMLRTYHPNGIEEYETFLKCANCDKSICPKCAKKCAEQLCQSINCSDCRGPNDVCPVHNDS